MPRVPERFQLSPDEYLAWERQQPLRHEYLRGDAFTIEPSSLRHNALCAAVVESLRSQLRGRCIVLTSGQRVVVPRREHYLYPDISCVCGPVITEPGSDDVLANPALLVEVLSNMTEQYDRGLKWEAYQRIESLTDYVLVSQSEPRIEHLRHDRTRTWLYQLAAAGERLVLSNGAILDVDAVFSGVLELPQD